MTIADQIRVEPDAKKMRGLIADAAAESKSIADSANSTSQEAKGTANAAKTQVDANKNQIANIVANGGSGSLQEIVDVRTGADGTVHASAGEHVRAIDSDLADIQNQKISKGYVTLADLTQEVKNTMVGGNVAVVGVNAVGKSNIKDSSITPRGIEGHSIINLLDDTKSIDGKIDSTGTIDTNNTDYRVSDFIEIVTGDTILCCGNVQNWTTEIVVYNESHEVVTYYNFVKSDGTSDDWGNITPLLIDNDNYRYIRFNYQKNISQPYCYLSSVMPSSYIPYNQVFIDWLKINWNVDDYIGQNSFDAIKLKDLTITGAKAINNTFGVAKLDLSYWNRPYLKDSIIYDKNTHIVTIPDLMYRVSGSWQDISASQFITQHPNGKFEFTINNLSILYFDQISAGNGEYPFVWKTQGYTQSQDGDRYIEILVVKDNGIISNYKVEFATQETVSLFINTEQRLVLPSNLYLIEEEPLRIYKQSILKNIRNEMYCKVALTSDITDEMPYNDYLYEKLELDKTKIGDTVRFSVSSDYAQNDGNIFAKNLNVLSVKAQDIVNKTANFIMFGDSITARGIPHFISLFAQNYGLTLTSLGTVNDELGTPCEGRGSWSFAQYIGLRTTNTTDDLPMVSFPSFLKLASIDDKTNHPDWCFRRTGVAKELSYTEDTDKTGDFYIFDFANYLSVNSFSTPKVAILAMGTNDFWKYPNGTDASDICKLAIEIISSQIHAVDSNIAIGVVPMYGKATGNYQEWDNIFTPWIDECNTFIDTLTNVDSIGLWMNRSTELSVPYTQVGDDLGGGVYTYYQNDVVHPTIGGTKEEAKGLFFYVANKM